MSLQLMPFARLAVDAALCDFVSQLLLAHDDVAELNTSIFRHDDGESQVTSAETFNIIPRDELGSKRRAMRNAVFVGGDVIVFVKIGHPRRETNDN